MRLIAIGLALSLTGCASLIVRDDDSAGMKAMKVGTRAVLVLPTLGQSESRVRQARWHEERQPRIDELNTCITNTKAAAQEALAIARPDLATGYLAMHDSCLSELRFMSGERGPAQRYGEALGRAGEAMRPPAPNAGATRLDFPQICNSTVVGSQIQTVCY